MYVCMYVCIMSFKFCITHVLMSILNFYFVMFFKVPLGTPRTEDSISKYHVKNFRKIGNEEELKLVRRD